MVDGRDGKKANVDPKLLELLACPLTKGPLTWDPERGELISRVARLA
ncbi:MAG: Trm112 family protein, partial [Mesorhizobium sp.]